MKSRRALLIAGCIGLPLTVAGCAASPNGQSADNSILVADYDAKTSNETVQQTSFDFEPYLPFSPLLPSYTAGNELTYSNITRNLDTLQNGDAISYTASYGTKFSIIEARSDQLHLASMPEPETKLTIGNTIAAAMTKHDDGESIRFENNGITYVVTTIREGVSLQTLEKICASMTIPASDPPNMINLSDEGPDSVNLLSFMPMKPEQLDTPDGYNLEVQGSSVNIVNGSKEEKFQFTYKKGSSYLTVIQSPRVSEEAPAYTHDSEFEKNEIDGTSVYFQPDQRSAQFVVSQNNLQIAIYSDLSRSSVTKVVHSILNNANSL